MKATHLTMAFLLCLAPLPAGRALTQAQIGGARAVAVRPAAPQPLRLTTEILRQNYCPGDEDLDTVRLQLRLVYTNAGATPLILYKGADLATRLLVSRSPEEAAAGLFEADTSVTWVTGGGGPTFACSHPDDSFVTLAPGATYETEADVTLFALRGGARTSAGALKPGLHFLQVEVPTWPGSHRQARALRDCWRGFGRFWADPVTSAPVPVSIEEHRAVTECLSDDGPGGASAAATNSAGVGRQR
jgi:hypothetical protein